MRVHPTLLNTKSKRWQFPAAFALLLFLLIMTVLKGPREVVVATAPPPIPKRSVVVAQKPIEAGTQLDGAALAMEDRPINTLPADAITTFEAVKGKVAAGPIPAGYPLAQALVTMPVLVKKDVEGPETAPVALDEADLVIDKIKADTVAVPVVFSTAAPPRGSRVALALTGVNGDTVLILDEGWVSESSGTRATLRVEPSRALFLQSAKKLGTINFIEIPAQGASPYAGHSVADITALEIAVTGAASKPEPKAGPKTQENRQFRSYAWIKGSGERYGIDEKGYMFLVDPTGKEIGPLLKNLE